MLPASFKLTDTALNEEIWANSKEVLSKTGVFNATDVTTPLAVLLAFNPKLQAANIDISKTYTNRFVMEAALLRKNKNKLFIK